MSLTPLEKLREDIEAYSENLQRVLERKLKAEDLVATLAQEFTNAKERLTRPSENEEAETLPDERAAKLKLDLEINKLQLTYEQKRGQLEMEYRRNPPPGDKVTEATVSAYIKSDEDLTNLKEEILNKEYERNILQTTYSSSSRLAMQAKREKTSEELERLRREWQLAKETLRHEEASLKVLEEKLAIYGLLLLAYWVSKEN